MYIFTNDVLFQYLPFAIIGNRHIAPVPEEAFSMQISSVQISDEGATSHDPLSSKVSVSSFKSVCSKFSLNLGNLCSLPYVMSIEDSYDDNENISDLKHIPLSVIKRILRLHARGREIPCLNYKSDDSTAPLPGAENLSKRMIALQKTKTDDSRPNPQDVALLCYLFSDPLLRQTFCSKLFMCKLAIPFITPDLPGLPAVVSQFALESIVLEWTPSGSSPAEVQEKSALFTDCDVVSCIRYGGRSESFSKSAFLNDMLSVKDTSHPTFFNRHSPLGGSVREIVDGLVEMSWYLPSGINATMFQEPTLFFNLRGDGARFPKQIEFIDNVSSIVLLSVDQCVLESRDFRHFLTALDKTRNRKSIIILVNSTGSQHSDCRDSVEIDEEEDNMYEWVYTYEHKQEGIKPVNIDKLKKNVRLLILDMIRMKSKKTLDKIISYAVDKETLNLARDNFDVRRSRSLADKMCESLSVGIVACKKTSCVLQDVLEESNKLQQELTSLVDPDQERQEEISIRLLDIENTQHTAVSKYESRPLIKEVLKAMESLLCLEETERGKQISYIIRSLGNRLDDKSRDNLPALHREYNRCWNECNESKKQYKTAQGHNKRLQDKLSAAAQKLLEASLGVEHIIREIGQMYAIAITRGFEEYEDSVLRTTLPCFPDIVAQLMLDGFPLELMNGDSSTIQLTWIQAVFNRLHIILKDQKIFVLSVLGVQSSGKSTLLNTMFGLQFAVSAGRCTRGVFAQLIRADQNTQSQLPFDYVMVIDTEGLRATELEAGVFKHDNEIATFVIGLGDVTIMNIKGENYADIQDVIQISVHAFLRMKLVSSDKICDKHCMFVHQNVSAINARERNKLGNTKLQEALDDAAREAAILENTEIDSFSKILKYNWEDHVYFISDIWLGDPPMAPPNEGYSNKIVKIKYDILSMLSNQTGKKFPNISGVLTKMEDLWKGIQSDDFVYNFRNTSEIKGFSVLEEKRNEMTFDLENFTLKLCAEKAFANIPSSPDMETVERNLIVTLEKEISDKAREYTSSIETFCSVHPNEYLANLWNRRKDGIIKDAIAFGKSRLNNQLALRKKEQHMGQRIDDAFKSSIIDNIKAAAEVFKGSSPSADEINLEFDDAWETGWRALSSAMDNGAISIVDEVYAILKSHFAQNEHLLNDALKQCNLSEPINPGESFRTSFKEEMIHPNDLPSKKMILTDAKFKKDREKALSQINDVFGDIEENLRRLKNKNVPPNRYQINEVLDKLSEIFSDKPAFSTDLRIRLSIHTYRYAIPKIQDICDVKQTFSAKLNNMKQSLRLYYDVLTKQGSVIDVLGSLIWGPIKICLVDYVAGRIATKVYEEYQSKAGIVRIVLTELAKKDDFNLYLEYIRNPRSYILQWMRQFIEKTYFDKTQGSCKYIIKVNEQIEKIVSVIKSVIDKTPKNLTPSKQIILQDWVKSLCSHDKVARLKLIPEMFWIVSSTKLVGVDEFESIIQLGLEKLSISLSEHFSKVGPNDFRWGSMPMHEELVERVWGCNKCCPSCGEPCQYQEADHLNEQRKKHSCVGHRPQAFMGLGNEKELIIWTCPVPTDTKQKVKSSKQSVTLYTRSFPDWDTPIRSDVSIYWQWVLFRFQDQLAKHYSTPKVRNIPQTWKDISPRVAIDSLAAYNQSIPQS